MSDNTTSEDNALNALIDIIKSAGSPETQQAQSLLLKRLALAGDVIPSRIPPPKNITEVGGYLNLLESMNRTDAMSLALSSALGVGDTTDLLSEPAAPALSFRSIANDIADGALASAAQPTINVRTDIVAGLTMVLNKVQGYGGVFPLWTPPRPALDGFTPPLWDPLSMSGRTLWALPTVAMVDPATDPIVLVRLTAQPGSGYDIAIRVTQSNPMVVAELTLENYTALAWDSVAQTYSEQALQLQALFFPQAALAAAGLVASKVATFPTAPLGIDWARLNYVAGLVPQVSTLGDELRQLYSQNELGNPAVRPLLGLTWNSKTFA